MANSREICADAHGDNNQNIFGSANEIAAVLTRYSNKNLAFKTCNLIFGSPDRLLTLKQTVYY